MSSDAGETCAICLHEMDGGDEHVLGCGHGFHVACVVGWFRRGASACPMCRDDGESEHVDRLDAFTVRERSKYLSLVARRADAPRDLKRLVGGLRKSRDALCRARKSLHAHRREHRAVFGAHAKMRTSMYRASRSVMAWTRRVGVFSCYEYPLPMLAVQSPFSF